VNQRRLRLGAAAIIVLTVGLDQLTKWWATEALADGDKIDIVPTLELDLAYNSGFSFSTGSGQGHWIGLLVIGLVGFLAWQVFKATAPARTYLFATILGGAVGNLLDRIFRADDGFLSGKVIDFIDVTWYAVFNVADMFVVCGCLAYVGYELMLHRREQADALAGEPSENVDRSANDDLSTGTD